MSMGIKSYICGELIFDKYPKEIQWRKPVVFSNYDGTNEGTRYLAFHNRQKLS